MTSTFLYPFLNFAAILLILKGKVEDEDFIMCGATQPSCQGLR
jgi:hypothetical protein